MCARIYRATKFLVSLTLFVIRSQFPPASVDRKSRLLVNHLVVFNCYRDAKWRLSCQPIVTLPRGVGKMLNNAVSCESVALFVAQKQFVFCRAFNGYDSGQVGARLIYPESSEPIKIGQVKANYIKTNLWCKSNLPLSIAAIFRWRVETVGLKVQVWHHQKKCFWRARETNFK